ncbi:MAG TPA: magnesium transporter, partial [Methanomicrobiales archaeon]|nr:magnesium transporter [Methanomicrobiales archaeon]
MVSQEYEIEVQELIHTRRIKALREQLVSLPVPEIAGIIDRLPSPDDVTAFRVLPRDLSTETFEYLGPDKQHRLIEVLAKEKARLVDLLNDLSPDDRTALLEELPGPVAQRLLNMLSPEKRQVALMLLGYPEDSIGRLMTTDYVAVRREWTVLDTLNHIRHFGSDSETLNVIYVVDERWRLLDDLHIREILLAEPETPISDLLDGRFTALRATDDQESAVGLFRDYDHVALPVTDSRGVLLGIVTIDDVWDIAEEEVTEDIQMFGGLEALDEPYMTAPLWTVVKKRAKWLVFLFIGEMLTTSAMAHFEGEIARAVVLAVFVPLIISSGGNSGSQAATLIIRAISVGEITLRDWWRVMRREGFSGLSLGAILGVVGIIRIMIWQQLFDSYGE